MKRFIQNFHNHYVVDSYKYLGSHYEDPSSKTVTFRVFAPHAEAVSVIGDFNAWNPDVDKMAKITPEGIWEVKIANVSLYANYKYLIKKGNKLITKQDPYAYYFETDGKTSSKVYNLALLQPKPKRLKKEVGLDQPLNIYEVNLSSWKRRIDGTYYDYRSFTEELIPYVKEMGYTHIEIMPLTEFPFLGSWGYQVTGYFGITSRYGAPHDFLYLVNKAHEAGIGVILDWVPGHFAKDPEGLIEFDGDFVYEDPHPLRREHLNWGTRVFNFSKPEVKSFLISSACFFFETYGIDGLRVDAVASMLYLDYDRKEWEPNKYGGKENLEAINFLKDLNTEVKKHFPGALMIAEESTAFTGVTKPVAAGGLGFTYKWNMGWMHDVLAYMSLDPLFRKGSHQKLTFSLVYAFSENYILPFSHDEVVHLKKSMLSKMPGNLNDKFKNLRLLFGYQATHPGKKLNFMGAEFGQLSEWNHDQEIEWHLLDEVLHKKLQIYVKDLNCLYLEYDMLWELDESWQGFSWVESQDEDRNLLIYERFNQKGESLLVILNFAGTSWLNYRLGVRLGKYRELINSDAEKYGGDNLRNFKLRTEAVISHNKPYSLVLNIPALSVIILEKVE